MSFDPNRPDEPYLYAADTLQLRVIRIDVRTGERRVVGDDPTLFNFPSSLGFLPQLSRNDSVSTMLVVSNQQHLTPITNAAITEDLLEPPFLATKVLLPKSRKGGHGHGHGHGHGRLTAPAYSRYAPQASCMRAAWSSVNTNMQGSSV